MTCSHHGRPCTPPPQYRPLTVLPPARTTHPRSTRTKVLLIVLAVIVLLLTVFLPQAQARAIATGATHGGGTIVLSDDLSPHCPASARFVMALDMHLAVTHRGCWTSADDTVFVKWFHSVEIVGYPWASFQVRR